VTGDPFQAGGFVEAGLSGQGQVGGSFEALGHRPTTSQYGPVELRTRRHHGAGKNHTFTQLGISRHHRPTPNAHEVRSQQAAMDIEVASEGAEVFPEATVDVAANCARIIPQEIRQHGHQIAGTGGYALEEASVVASDAGEGKGAIVRSGGDCEAAGHIDDPSVGRQEYTVDLGPVDQRQGGQAAALVMGRQQRGKIEVAQHIAVVDDEGVGGGEEIAGAVQRAGGAEDPGLETEVETCAVRSLIEVRLDAVGTVMGVDGDASGADRGEGRRGAVQQRHAVHWQQRLGEVRSERPQTGAQTGRQDHAAHLTHTTGSRRRRRPRPRRPFATGRTPRGDRRRSPRRRVIQDHRRGCRWAVFRARTRRVALSRRIGRARADGSP